jgi:hypothetical protein
MCKTPIISLDRAGASAAPDVLASLSADLRADRPSGKSKKRRRAGEGAGAGAGAPPPPTWSTLTRITISVDSLSSPGASELLSASPFAQAGALSWAKGGGKGAPPPTAASVLASYDLVCIVPGDAAVLRAVLACGCADLISLELGGGKLKFPLALADVTAVLAAGVAFEVEYAPAVRDPTARRFLLTNLASLSRLTRGRGLVLASAARAALEVRPVADAAAIVALAGLTAEQARRAGGEAVVAVLRHAEERLGGAKAGADASTAAPLFVQVRTGAEGGGAVEGPRGRVPALGFGAPRGSARAQDTRT